MMGEVAQHAVADAYERPLVPAAFDLLISAMFLPFGGVRRLRRAALDRAGVRAGEGVLELGCGTGGVTELLLERGARVTAVDGSARMLERARRRAPGARFERRRLEAMGDLGGGYDVVLFAFVLHELPQGLRREALAFASGALAPGGRVVVLDHAVPSSGGFARAWRSFLLRLEPPSVVDCIEGGYASDFEAAGLGPSARHELAGGTAAVAIVTKAGGL